jgi:thioester reductase-like protein
VHCGAIYDITMAESAQWAANVDGTRSVIELARRLNATLHHVSSIAVAGDFHGEYTEADFDVDQNLPTPYHRTKFEAEQLVRTEPGLRYRSRSCRRSRRSCCPTAGVPTSFRSTMWSTRWCG